MGGVTPEPVAKFTQHLTANDLKFPYCSSTTCSRGVSFVVQDIKDAWIDWRNKHICDATSGGTTVPASAGCASTDVCGDPSYLRVWKKDSNSTVDEGIGYAMYMSMLFDEQLIFDKLWKFARKSSHLTEDGFTHWEIGSCGSVKGTGSSEDGEQDIALALVSACMKKDKGAWAASSLSVDYCLEARNLVDRLWESQIDKPGAGMDSSGNADGGLSQHPGYELMPGDQWNMPSEYPQGIVNLSYFDPAALRVFGKFRGKTLDWNKVIDRQYELVQLSQSAPGNCSGLVHQWNKYNGACQAVPWQGPVDSCAWYFDSGRVAWRQARSAFWYPSELAKSVNVIDRIGSFFSSVGIANVNGSHKLDGTPHKSEGPPFFVANAGMSIWAADHLTALAASCGDASGALVNTGVAGRQAAYDRTKAVTEPSTTYQYFNHAIRLFGLLLMSGNDVNIYERAQLVTGGTTPTCSDGVQNQNETGVDCGGACTTTCPTCADGVKNGDEVGVDCGGSCNACASCADGVKNGTESAVDCGGTCPKCADTKACLLNADCQSGLCQGSVCTPVNGATGTNNGLKGQYKCGNPSSTLNNSIHPTLQIVNNGASSVNLEDVTVRYWYETVGEAVDGKTMQVNCYYADRGCANLRFGHSAVGNSKYVQVGFTTAAGALAVGANTGTIDLGINAADWSNFDEADDWSRDATKTAFADWTKVTVYHKGMLIWGTEPGGASGSSATCTDAVQNGTETGVDCGGSCSACTSCSDGIRNGAETGVDCGGPCRACVSCVDGLKNQNESDVDCGGSCDKCDNSKTCLTASDCRSNLCTSGVCTPMASCTDGIKNQDESAIDCGGSCPKCGDAKTCNLNSDCLSQRCASGVCSAASCSDAIMNQDETGVDCGGAVCSACSAPGACTLASAVLRSGGNSGNFDTPNAVCFKVADNLNGWGCSNFEGRTLKVNGTSKACGATITKVSGYYLFDVSAGSVPWASIYWW
jgi:endo-1,4-beta-D-glucanase Y